MTAITAALRRRADRDGSTPLLTYYDLGTGERTELSGTTFDNWVSKTCHLFADLGVAPGEIVASPLVARHPGHWVALITTAAAWQLGATVVPGESHDAAITVIGPSHPAAQGGELPAGEVVICSLHPLGLGLDSLPAGLVDYGSEARIQPDATFALAGLDSDLAWSDDTTHLTFADLGSTPSSAGRVLVHPGDPLETVIAALVAPLLGGGSAVVVAGADDPERVAAIVRAERVTS